MGFDRKFELDVLAGCVDDQEYRRSVKRIIGEEDVWSTDANREIWEVVKRLGGSDRLTGEVIGRVLDRVDNDDLAEAIYSTAQNVFKRSERPHHKHFARSELRDWVRTARAKQAMAQAVKEMKKGNIDRAEELLTGLRSGSDLTSPYELSSWFDTFEERQKARIERKNNPEEPSIKTYFPSFDRLLNGGIRPTQIGLLVAHTGRGKSGVANHLTMVSAASGNLTLEISTEMNKELTDTRLDAKFFRYPVGDFIKAKFTGREQEQFAEKMERLKERLSQKLYTASVPVLTMTHDMLEDMIDEVEQETGQKVKLVVFDSPEHMKKLSRFREERHQQAFNFWGCKEIVERRKFAMWATVQAPREFLGKLIVAEATAESYDKARISDIMLTLNQTEKERRAEIIRAYVAKNRSGEAGHIIWLQTDWERMHVEETEEPHGNSSGDEEGDE